MKTTVELDASNRIVLSRELRRAAGIPRGQKLFVSATPGRIVLEMEANASGRIVKRGKLKVWTGAVPTTNRGGGRTIPALHPTTFLDTWILVGALLESHPEHMACLSAIEDRERLFTNAHLEMPCCFRAKNSLSGITPPRRYGLVLRLSGRRW